MILWEDGLQLSTSLAMAKIMGSLAVLELVMYASWEYACNNSNNVWLLLREAKRHTYGCYLVSASYTNADNDFGRDLPI